MISVKKVISISYEHVEMSDVSYVIISFDINKLSQGKHVEKTKASHEFCIDCTSSVPVKVLQSSPPFQLSILTLISGKRKRILREISRTTMILLCMHTKWECDTRNKV